MASEAVTTKAGELCTALVAKAKAYRIANINARMASSGTAGFGVDHRLEAKKAKIEADHTSVTWVFETRAAGDDIEIVGTAPADRGGAVKVWGYVTATGLIGKNEADAGLSAVNITDADQYAAFTDTMSHLGAHW